jgi:hypothetical protein
MKMDIRTAEKFITFHNDKTFLDIALVLFRYHYEHTSVYSSFCHALNVKSENIDNLTDIPFLPVSFFKTAKVTSFLKEDCLIFESSGTSLNETSKHYVNYPELYVESITNGFKHFYGDPSQYSILALLPSYLERPNSSLIYMVSLLMKLSGNPNNGFYLYNHSELAEKLHFLNESGQKTILFGVSFALTDFAAKYRIDFPELIVIETGGMKGRRKEITREELHGLIQAAFGIPSVHSEYGMTELLSQAWSKSNGLFRCPPWMKILIRDTNDPLHYHESGKTGGVNVIDFANAFSCPFIATDDLGVQNEDGTFYVKGRFDSAQIRGCNTMLDDFRSIL